MPRQACSHNINVLHLTNPVVKLPMHGFQFWLSPFGNVPDISGNPLQTTVTEVETLHATFLA